MGVTGSAGSRGDDGCAGGRMANFSIKPTKKHGTNKNLGWAKGRIKSKRGLKLTIALKSDASIYLMLVGIDIFL